MAYMIWIGVAVLALFLGPHLPLLGAPVMALLLGALAAPAMIRLPPAPGLAVVTRYGLVAAVALLGLGMDLTQVFALGPASLGFMVFTTLFALGAAALFARLLGLRGDVAILVGAGTCICGGSAIAAVAGVLKAEAKDTARALSTIFLYNIIAALLFPVLGHALGLDPAAFGLWAGTAINDTSSVLAAAFAYGGDAGPVGMAVKMARTLMIFPVSLGVALWMRHEGRAAGSWKRAIPWPVVAFAGALLLRALVGECLPGLGHMATEGGHVAMVVALAAIGLKTHLGEIFTHGRKAMAVGALTWIALGGMALLLMRVTGIGG